MDYGYSNQPKKKEQTQRKIATFSFVCSTFLIRMPFIAVIFLYVCVYFFILHHFVVIFASNKNYWSSRWAFFLLSLTLSLFHAFNTHRMGKNIMNNWLIRMVVRWENNGQNGNVIHLLQFAKRYCMCRIYIAHAWFVYKIYTRHSRLYFVLVYS